jgi:N-acyl-D-aspartate/D-glutamate deacylase
VIHGATRAFPVSRRTPRETARRAGAIVLLAVVAAPALGQQADYLIRGASLYDGSGVAPRIADLAIRGDRIVFVGAATGWTAPRTIDARGLIVAPGFIDPHMHAMGDLASRDRADRLAGYALMQGITTVITGNDGGGPIAIGRALDGYRRDSIGPNAALLVGHGSVRGNVLGAAARAPSAAELDSMKTLVDRAMREGAFGLSSGLYYAPGSFAQTDEVIALARVAAAHGGIYDTHQRDESSYTIGLLASVQEVLDIGRGARIPVNISHIKALGVDVWGKAPEVIALVKKAQAEGLRVTADQYPWTASGTSLSAALLPRWAEAGGRDSLRARLSDPAIRPRIVREMTDNLRRRGGAGTLLMTSLSSRADAAALGRTLADYAAARGTDPIETAIGIIQSGGAGLASFNMNDQDIETFMKEPFVMTGSDGSGGHPRKYGTYPRKIRQYVLDKPVITMERMIQASSSQVAETFGIPLRGRLREGFFADVIVFDPRTIRETATYVEPEKHAVGIRWVFVNGIPAVEDGHLTGALPGRALSKGAQ